MNWDLFWTIVAPILKWLGLVMLFVMPVASLLTWGERRQGAMMQDRLGPNRANIGKYRAWGIFHFVADALKMLFKEDFVPGKAHRALFTLAPVMALAPVLIAFALIPFGPPIDIHKVFTVLDPNSVNLGPDKMFHDGPLI